MSKPITNIAASVRQRLLNLAHERKEDFGLVLTKYGLERVLFRLSQSKYRDVFVLKGALLFELWTKQRYRPTRDGDFLARGENSPERFTNIFKELCAMKTTDDGITFDATTVTAERITEDADYEGIRIKFVGLLEAARVPIQIDLGFGDAITPGPIDAEYPTLLDMPAPVLLTYPKETVVAEKFEAIVSLGMANTRMKDFHDIQSLCRQFSFDGVSLSEAILKTFKTRGTELPTKKPVAFTSEFYEDAEKKKQWAAFCNKNRGYVKDVPLQSVCRELEDFLMPVFESLSKSKPFSLAWTPTGYWN